MKNKNMVQRQNKRQALIDAAVRLMVEKGDPRLVSTRAIVSMALTSKSAIDYHFGNKAGLVTAVLDDIGKRHNCISGYYNKKRSLLDSHEGKILFVNGLLDAFQDFFQKNESNSWHMLVRQCVIQSYHEVKSEEISFQFFLESDVNAFYKIFHAITGRDGADESYAWFMTIMLPLSTRGYRKNKLTFPGKQAALSLDYDDYFLEFCKNKLMAGWGLIREIVSKNPQDPQGETKYASI